MAAQKRQRTKQGQRTHAKLQCSYYCRSTTDYKANMSLIVPAVTEYY